MNDEHPKLPDRIEEQIREAEAAGRVRRVDIEDLIAMAANGDPLVAITASDRPLRTIRASELLLEYLKKFPPHRDA